MLFYFFLLRRRKYGYANSTSLSGRFLLNLVVDIKMKDSQSTQTDKKPKFAKELFSCRPKPRY